MSLCKYKDIFGKPGEGVHSYRFMDFAIVDILGTIVGAYLISKFTDYSFVKVLIVLFITGIILHRLFNVQTTVDKIIFN